MKLIRILLTPLTLFCACILALSPTATAQHSNALTLNNVQEITRDTIERRQQELQSPTSKTPSETASQLAELYNSILISLDDTDSFIAQKKIYQEITAKGESEIKRLGRKLAELRAHSDEMITVSSNLLGNDIQNLLDKEEASLATVKTKITNLDDEINTINNSPLAIRQRLATIKQEQDSASNELKILALHDDESPLKQAKRWAHNTKLNALRAEVDMLDLALVSKPIRSKIMAIERDTNIETEAKILDNIEIIQAKLNIQRSKEAQASLGITEKAIEGLYNENPTIKAYAEKNQELSLELAQLTEDLNSAALRSKEVSSAYEEISSEFELLRQKTAVAGLSKVFGEALIEQRSNLPKVSLFKQEQKKINDKITASALRRLELNAYLNQKYRSNNYEQELVKSLLDPNTQTINAINELIQYRKNLAQSLDNNHSVFVRTLTDTSYNLNQLTTTLAELDRFILKQLMWVRTYKSITQVSADDLKNELLTYSEIIHNFSIKNIIQFYLDKPWLYLGIALGLVILFFIPRLKKQKAIYLDNTQNATFASLLWSTKYLSCVALQSLLVTICVVQVFYLVFFLFTSIAVPPAIIDACLYCFFVDYLTRLLAPNEIFVRYFRWPEQIVTNLYRGFLILRNVFLTLLLISIINNGILVNETGGIFGAMLVISMYLVFAFSIYQLFSVKYNITLSIIKRSIYGSVSLNQKILKYLLVLSFILCAIFFLIGYRYSAALITSRIFESMLALAYIAVIHQVAIRWLIDLELREHFRFNQQQTDKTSTDALITTENPTEKTITETPTNKLEALSIDSRKLIDAVFIFLAILAFALIWGRILPAFNIFNDIVLWAYTDKIAGIEQQVPVTLNHFLILLISLPVAYIVVRRLPAFIEMVILNHLNLSASSRYTITTLTSYCLAAAAIGIIGSSIGFSWYKIQWAVAALSVGIGFGLQEIVANFISGLIILFERPIRVGDLVTINNQTGYVTRIQIRATTILDYDNKELLVPNKEFITNSLLNWTLTDKEVRVMISVGIAYGSDVDKALAILEQVAIDHPLVLSEPKPTVTFENFNDNALSLFLRCRIGNIEDRLKVLTELNKSINKKYQEEKISIAFPQRDLHIDFTKPIEVNLNKQRTQRDNPDASVLEPSAAQ